MSPLRKWIIPSASLFPPRLSQYLATGAFHSAIALGCLTAPLPSQAQTVPDASLGEDVSVITVEESTTLITGGMVRGGSLFHSFETFNVPQGRSLYFNPASDITQIFSCVTGSDPSQIDDPSAAGADQVRLNAQTLTLQNGKLSSKSYGNQPTADIHIEVAQEVVLGNSHISAVSSQGSGNSGDIEIKTRQIQLNGSQPGQPSTIITITDLASSGNAGSLSLIATDSLELVGHISGPFIAQQYTVPQLIEVARNGTAISSSAFGSGLSGDTTIQTDRLSLRDGATIGITSGVFNPPTVHPNQTTPKPPNITLQARETHMQGLAAIGAATLGSLEAGDVMIQGELLRLDQGAAITATSFGSNLPMGEAMAGQAGEIAIQVDDLQVLNGSVIGASTDGSRDGGMVRITAETILVQGTSLGGEFPASLRTGVGSDTVQVDNDLATGQGGALLINANQLQVLDGGKVIVSAAANSLGNAGNLTIAAQRVELLGQGSDGQGAAIPSSLEAQSLGQGEAGQLTLKTSQLIAQDGAQIIAASRQGNGGDISIEADFIIIPAGENSDITADSSRGQGGKVNITARGIWGIEPRSKRSPQSDITSRSAVGIDGTITLASPAPVDHATATELPSRLLQTEPQIIAGCPSNKVAQFVVSGRGGLPINPQHQLQQRLTLEDWRESPSPASSPTGSTVPITQAAAISPPRENSRLPSQHSPGSPGITSPITERPLEAQGFRRNALGEIQLTARPSQTPPALLASCQPLPGAVSELQPAATQPAHRQWGHGA